MAADLSFEALVGLVSLLEDVPAPLASSPVDRKEDLPVLCLRLDDIDEHLLACLQLALRIGAKRTHLMAGNDAFRLRGDVDEGAVAVPPHHGSFDNLAALGRLILCTVFEQRFHVGGLVDVVRRATANFCFGIGGQTAGSSF